jgi:hypothetical protein
LATLQAGDAKALATIRTLYELWRRAFKPEQWHKPFADFSNGNQERFDIFLTNLQTILSINNSTLPSGCVRRWA